jgi:hypothetical protein
MCEEFVACTPTPPPPEPEVNPCSAFNATEYEEWKTAQAIAALERKFNG